MPALMPVDVVVIPTSHTLSTLGDLFGPLGALAVGAVVVALGVLVIGLLNERREGRQRERVRAEATSVLRARRAGHSAAHAA